MWTYIQITDGYLSKILRKKSYTMTKWVKTRTSKTFW